jgi:cyclopropane-fatty-acyl-phospholipid synthase
MAAYLDGAIRSAMSAWAARTAKDLNLPLAVRWRDEGEDWVRLGEFDSPRLYVEIRDAKGAAAMLAPTLDSLGEAYVEGHIDVEGSVTDVLEIAHALSRGNPGAESGREVVPEEELRFVGRSSWLQRVMSKVADRSRHTRHSDEKAIQYHYDVSNDFYALWLDPAMVYSCAYFENGDETLAEAQQKKIDHILDKLRLEPGHTLLDIGCGWGALLIRAAQRHDIRCVGVTLSQNQYELARERVAQAGLADRVDIRLQDYRDIPGQFDRISSVGMFEHVGLKNLVPYFRRVHDLLKPGGWALNHGITSSDAFNRETSYGGGRFIDKYVFPDGELPHIGTVLTDMQLGGLEAFDVESLRRHYARTLHLWSESFEAQSAALRGMVEERTWRIWRVYLAGCAWAFEHDEISIFQVLCHRAGESAQRLPWSRRWLYG